MSRVKKLSLPRLAFRDESGYLSINQSGSEGFGYSIVSRCKLTPFKMLDETRLSSWLPYFAAQVE